MKIAPLMERMSRYFNRFNQILVYTGQHYDKEIYKIFYDLKFIKPDIYLRASSGFHGAHNRKNMVEFEKVCFQEKPDLIIVFGDVN